MNQCHPTSYSLSNLSFQYNLQQSPHPIQLLHLQSTRPLPLDQVLSLCILLNSFVVSMRMCGLGEGQKRMWHLQSQPLLLTHSMQYPMTQLEMDWWVDVFHDIHSIHIQGKRSQHLRSMPIYIYSQWHPSWWRVKWWRVMEYVEMSKKKQIIKNMNVIISQ